MLWVLFGGVALAAILAILHAFGTCVRQEQDLHDLRVRVHKLRSEYLERIAALRRGQAADADA